MTQTTEQQQPELTARDLKGFDRRRVALIREMESHGWRGRRGSKGHIIMRAPDGITTTGVSQKVISPKNEHHVAADFRRWLRQQQAPAPKLVPISFPSADSTSVLVALTTRERPAPAPEPVDTAPEPWREVLEHGPPAAAVVAVERNTQDCGLCGDRSFATLQALSVHRVRVHSKIACEVCDRPMAPGNLPQHLRKHVADIGTHEQAMREVIRLRAELDRARTETIEWERIADEIEDRYTAVKDRLDNAVGYLLGES